MIELNIRWRAPDAMVDTMVELARKHQLVMYDPQGPSLHSPVADDEPEDIAGQVKQGLIAGAVGLLAARWSRCSPRCRRRPRAPTR